MKRLILLFTLLTVLCMQSFGQIQPSAESDTLNETTVVSSIDDATDYHHSEDFAFGNMATDIVRATLIIPILAITLGIGLPIFIIAIVLYFRYKNKQAKYKLASEALAAGKEIPKELFNENTSKSTQNHDTLAKGIKDICLGIGLGVFLWLLTGVEFLAAIGFLIFCMGVGKVIIAHATRPSNSKDNQFPGVKE